jgi:glycosyltransferase involved in cell wall biosynthesis
MTAFQPLKIVHLDTGLGLRGGQRQLLLLARKLRDRGHTQLIVCPEGSELEVRARQDGLRVFSWPAHDPGHAHGILQLRQQLLATPYRILHAHDGKSQTLAWLASLGMPVRRAASRRVTFLPSDRWSHRLKYAHTCDAVVAVSDFVRQLLIRAGVPESKIEVIPDGIEIPTAPPTLALRTQARARWGFDEQEFVVGHLGAFTPEKGQDVALESLHLVAVKLPQVRLLLAGDGPTLTRPEIARAIARAKDRVTLCSVVENLEEFYPALDLFVMPSRAEGLGSSVLHAMAFGLPVVASRVGGLPEIVAEGEMGWLVSPGSPSALAVAIVAAASDQQRLMQFGQNARQRAHQFSADIMLERTEALYCRLLSR